MVTTWRRDNLLVKCKPDQFHHRKSSASRPHPQHILLGLVQEGSGVAANVLKNLNVDLSDFRHAVEKLAISGSADTKGKSRSTPEAKRVIVCAMAIARELNHNHIGTEHLLLGLLREQDGIAAQALANLEVTSEQATAEIINLWCRAVQREEEGCRRQGNGLLEQ